MATWGSIIPREKEEGIRQEGSGHLILDFLKIMDSDFG
jgi:hypothetical protein